MGYRELIIARRPLAYWRLDDPAASGTFRNLGRRSVNLNSGALTQEPTRVRGLHAGVPAAASRFSGTDFASAGATTLFDGLNDFSIEFWIDLANWGSTQWGVLSQGSNGTNFSLFLGVGNYTGGISFQFGVIGSINGSASDPLSHSTDSHVAVTRQGTRMRLFKNGDRVNEVTITADPLRSAGAAGFTLYCAFSEITANYAQMNELQDLAVYDYALGDHQVLESFHAGRYGLGLGRGGRHMLRAR